MTTQEIESRAQKAQDLFKQGFNCSQAVFASCADLYGIHDEQLALRLAASFGLHNGSATPHDSEGKMANYAFVQQLAGDFKAKYGSLVCAELLGLAPKGSTMEYLPAEALRPKPEERTQQYYEKRPCVEMIAEAVRIYLRNI